MKKLVVACIGCLIMLISCRTIFSEIEERKFGTFKVINQTDKPIYRIAVRMNALSNGQQLDSLLISNLSAHDSTVLNYNTEYLPTDRDVNVTLYAWDDDFSLPLISQGWGIGKYNLRYTIKKDTILFKWAVR